jgi:WD40 repeat protein
MVLTGGVRCVLWDATTKELLAEFPAYQSTVRTVAFSPDGLRVATGSFDFTARLWETATGKLQLPPLSHRGRVRHIAFSPDGSRLVTASFDNTARVWDLGTGKPIGPFLRHTNWVVDASFSPDGRTVVTASTDGTARFWRTPPPVEPDQERILLSIQVPTGIELSEDGIIHVLDAETWEQRRQRLQELGGSVLP